MPELLIVRSASFQQLDKNLPQIRRQFPGHAVWLLTHEHGRALAQKYRDLAGVLVYPHAGSFTARIPAPVPRGLAFDDTVLLASNLSGCGFANVYAFARTLPSGRLHLCNVAGEIRSLEPGEVRRTIFRDRLHRALAVALGIPLGVLLTGCFAAGLRVLGQRRSAP